MPCPIRLGPEPRISTFGRASAARPPTRPRGRSRRRCSGTGCARRTRRRRCRRSCRPAARPSRWRSVRTPSSPASSGPQRGQLPVGEARPLGPAQQRARRAPARRRSRRAARRARRSGRRTTGRCRDRRATSATERARPQQPLDARRSARRSGWRASGSPRRVGHGPEARGRRLHRAQRLAQRLGERPPERHRLADALHRRGQLGVGAGELLEREPRDLHHDVVQRRLERGRGLAGDVVADLVERVADREPRRDLGDREPGGLGRQRRATATPAGSSRSRRGARSRGAPRTGCCSRRCRRRPRAARRCRRRACAGTRGR